ncbi:MAG: TonB family protein [Candidatus Eisenbacteria bacterium]|uniref:TonB family protein n=1 Tax=Eiseniibacteriota bacterium TaxID=2212470 RepID=A0A538T9N1_UNCEI|nr:MAG: TonB family protein [Candidatus Eisenbacteria bacterium]
MVSAFASSPPPFRFGPGDLRANARKFLECALLFSALVHLTVVGFIRVASERGSRRGEQRPEGKPEQAHTVNLLVPLDLPPLIVRTSGLASAKDGVVEPVPPRQDFQWSDFGFSRPAKPIGAEGEGGINKGPPRPASPEVLPAFRAVDSPPELIDAPKPAYPDWAKDAGVEGRVLLRVLVGTDGHPRKVIVAGGLRALGEDAVKAVMGWTFHPGLSNGNPVEVWVEVPVLYRL